MSAPPRALARSSASVALGTALSRVTGLVRVGVLAYAIGRASLADTYNLANSTPNIVYELVLGGVLSATLVPLFVEHLERRDERATAAVTTVALLALLALSAVAVAAAPWIARLYTLRADPDHRDAQVAVATVLIRYFLPQIAFYGLTTLATALLNARRRYVAAAFAPVLNNVVVVAIMLEFVRRTNGPRAGWVEVERVRGDGGLLLLLGLGTTAGIGAMAVALLPALRRAGVRWSFRPEWSHPAVRRLVRLSSWTAGYVVANQLALSVVLVLAAHQEGGVAAYQYAFIFFQLPHGLFAVSIMTTVTPELARSAAAGDTAGLREQFSLGLRYLGLVVVPAAVGYAVLAQPLVGLLERGGFAGDDVRVTGDTLQALALGLPAFSAYLYTLRGFYALQDTRTPFLVNCLENALNVAFAIVLYPSLGVQGLALAYSAAYTVAAVAALALLRRRIGGLDGARTGALYARAGVAGAACAVVAWPLAGAFDPAGPGRAALALLVAVAGGGAAYVGVLRALRTPELAALGGLVRRSPAGPASGV